MAGDFSELLISFFGGPPRQHDEFRASAPGRSILKRLARIPDEPLSLSHLNSVLWDANKGPLSDGFYQYYLLSSPDMHPYPVEHVVDEAPSLHPSHVVTVSQLEFGIRRFFTDALLYFPSTDAAFERLRKRTFEELRSFFAAKRVDHEAIQGRGPAVELEPIPTEDRYLISELACRAYSLEASPDPFVLTELVREYKEIKQTRIPVKRLVDAAVQRSTEDLYVQLALPLGAEEFIEVEIDTEEQLRTLVRGILERFNEARRAALANTQKYLSMLRELDVYVATSMRDRKDFRDVAQACLQIFQQDPRLRPYHLRYFDPTLSGALSHEDKGILECIMVDHATVVIYLAQEKESWGKDAEATRALNQGKPVIIYCPPTQEGHQRMLFFRDIHPLSRLLDMQTGVAVGAMITDDIATVRELLLRIITNRMQYTIDQKQDGSLRLRDRLTNSVVRISTADEGLERGLAEFYIKD